MCEFISWIEYENRNYFLTSLDLETKEGKKLIREKRNGDIFHEDISGHGFIRAYYPELKNLGKNKECANFASPSNFPGEIVDQIKKGNMRYGALYDYNQILTSTALKNMQADAEWKQAHVKLEQAKVKIFWKIFDNPRNRVKEWR